MTKCAICNRYQCNCAAKYTPEQLDELELQAMYLEEPEDVDNYYEV